jgi:hypothetical protein
MSRRRPAATAYAIRHSRGGEVPQKTLVPDYAGLFGNEGWKPYEALEHARRQICLQHLLHDCYSRL